MGAAKSGQFLIRNINEVPKRTRKPSLRMKTNLQSSFFIVENEVESYFFRQEGSHRLPNLVSDRLDLSIRTWHLAMSQK